MIIIGKKNHKKKYNREQIEIIISQSSTPLEQV